MVIAQFVIAWMLCGIFSVVLISLGHERTFIALDLTLFLASVLVIVASGLVHLCICRDLKILML